MRLVRRCRLVGSAMAAVIGCDFANCGSTNAGSGALSTVSPLAAEPRLVTQTKTTAVNLLRGFMCALGSMPSQSGAGIAGEVGAMPASLTN